MNQKPLLLIPILLLTSCAKKEAAEAEAEEGAKAAAESIPTEEVLTLQDNDDDGHFGKKCIRNS